MNSQSPNHPDPVAALLEAYTPEVEAGWRLRVVPPWVHFQRPREAGPKQGWKLHVSATVEAAAEVLERALPLLIAERVPFKVATSKTALGALNDGSGGLTQIGKFITVYPASDEQAVRLAARLHDATWGLRGPTIPSDRPLKPGSLVYYRYGGFGSRLIQMRWGEVLSALETPTGELVPDTRETEFRPPAWATDPFAAAGLAEPLVPLDDRIGGRYVPVGRISYSARGFIYLAVDVQTPRRCVIKEAVRDALVDRSGADACERLRKEAAMLRRLGGDGRFPSLFDVVETNRGLAVAMEDLVGDTMHFVVRELARDGKFVPMDRLLGWATELADILGSLHAQGIVFRDLKAANVMVMADDSLRLFDLELAYDLREGDRVAPGMGTPGYMSPQQAAGAPPSVHDDVYSFGALLWFLLTAREPGKLPRYGERASRLCESVNPGTPRQLLQLVDCCLSRETGRRPASMGAIVEILGETPAQRETVTLREFADSELQGFRALARRVGDSLCRLARVTLDGDGVMWESLVGPGKHSFQRDINSGTSGVLIALSEIVEVFGDPDHRSVLARGAEWLLRTERPAAAVCPGLYVGEAGVGAALLRAGLTLGDERLIEAAERCSRWVAEQPLDSPDLFNGAAGRLRFHLAVARVVGGGEHLRVAQQVGEWLLARAQRDAAGGWRWQIPEGFGSLSGARQTGYAHGAPGIGDALLDLFESAGDERFLDAARGVTRYLGRLAAPVLGDHSGLDWPADERDVDSERGPSVGRVGPFWCHGAAGISRFLFHVAAVDSCAEALALGRRGALSAGRGARWSAPCQCHGIFGNIECLIDAYQATGDRSFLREARPMLDFVVECATEAEPGLLVWPFDAPKNYTPDFMIGFSGAAACLLRGADHGNRPHLLSLSGLTQGLQCQTPGHQQR